MRKYRRLWRGLRDYADKPRSRPLRIWLMVCLVGSHFAWPFLPQRLTQWLNGRGPWRIAWDALPRFRTAEEGRQ